MIQTEALTKKYGRFLAVDDLNINVKKGSFYGLLGENGAGKTTTIGMLTGLTRITKGEAYILGMSIKNDFPAIKQRIGVMPQSALFYSNRTVLDHMLFYSRLKGSCDRKECISLIEQVGLSDKIKAKVGKLSHGMTKLLGIAQAMIGSPELLFLDEPTAGLDPKVKFSIKRLVKGLGITVFYSSHDLAEVEELCDYVGILKNGRLIKEDNVKDLTLKEKEVRFKIKNISNNIVNELKKIKQIKNVTVNKEEISIVYDSKTNLTPLITKTLVKNNAEILEVSQGKSLEEVFVKSV